MDIAQRQHRVVVTHTVNADETLKRILLGTNLGTHVCHRKKKVDEHVFSFSCAVDFAARL